MNVNREELLAITPAQLAAIIAEGIAKYVRSNPPPPYWTVEQLAERMECHPSTVRRMKLRRDLRGRIPYDVGLEALGLRAASR